MKMVHILYKVIASDPSVFRLVQEYGSGGLLYFRRNNTQKVRIDSVLREKLNYPENREDSWFEQQELFDKAYQTFFSERLEKEADSRSFNMAFYRYNRSLLSFDCRLTTLSIEGEEWVMLVCKKATTEAQQQLHTLKIIAEQDILEILAFHSLYLLRIDLEGNYKFANDYFCQRLGLKKEEVIGRSSLDHILPEDRQKCIETVTKCFEQPGKLQQVILRKPSPGGGYFSNDWFFVLLTDNNGQPLEVLCTGYDISIHNFQLLYEKAPTMLHSIDQNGTIINVSDFWLQKLGYSREEVIGKKSVEFLTLTSREYAEQKALPDFYKNFYCVDEPFQMVCKSGEVLDILLSATLVKDQQKGTPVSVAYLRDITQHEKDKLRADAMAKLNASILKNTKIQMWAFNGEKYNY